MSVLLDTAVPLGLRKKQRNENVVRWLNSMPAGDLYLSVITIAEVKRGIASKKTSDPDFASRLAGLLEHYGDRILPVDLQVAHRWGQLSGELGHSGVDILIAATALEHGLAVATKNIRQFTPTGVAVINPFE